MPMPRWWTPINKRVFNPPALKSGKWSVLTHVGRSSGAVYRTPLDAMPIEGGFLIAAVYGAESDWVQNVLAAGRAELEVDGARVEVTAPRIVSGIEADTMLPPDAPRPPAFLNIDEFLLLRPVG